MTRNPLICHSRGSRTRSSTAPPRRCTWRAKPLAIAAARATWPQATAPTGATKLASARFGGAQTASGSRPKARPPRKERRRPPAPRRQRRLRRGRCRSTTRCYGTRICTSVGWLLWSSSVICGRTLFGFTLRTTAELGMESTGPSEGEHIFLGADAAQR